VTNLYISLCDEHIYYQQKTEYKNTVSDKEFRKLLLSSNVKYHMLRTAKNTTDKTNFKAVYIKPSIFLENFYWKTAIY